MGNREARELCRLKVEVVYQVVSEAVIRNIVLTSLKTTKITGVRKDLSVIVE